MLRFYAVLRHFPCGPYHILFRSITCPVRFYSSFRRRPSEGRGAIPWPHRLGLNRHTIFPPPRPPFHMRSRLDRVQHERILGGDITDLKTAFRRSILLQLSKTGGYRPHYGSLSGQWVESASFCVHSCSSSYSHSHVFSGIIFSFSTWVNMFWA